MRLLAKNFGPLRNLDIDIKPLTILIGKNNLGKSYAAQLFYVMLCMLNDLRFGRPIFLFEERVVIRTPAALFVLRELEIKRLTKQIRKEKLTDEEVVKRLVKLILDQQAQNIQTLLKVWLERIFGVRTSKLVNINSTSAQIECDLFRDLVFKVTITRRKQINVKLEIKKSKIQMYLREFAPILEKIREKRRKKTYVEQLANELDTQLMSVKKEVEFFGFDIDRRRIKPNAYFIPAGRAGLIESYDTVVEALFFHAAKGPALGFSIPPLSGMAAEFYSVLRSLSGQKGPLSKVTATWFKELLDGDVILRGVRLRKTQRAARTRMIYRFRLGDKQSTIDLIHAASMIKELAPIYLIVRELVHPGQFLIIEEPESHLHPGAQYKLARILAKLTKEGVYVFLTTHSPVMLRRMAHFVGKLPSETERILDFRDVGIYWLKEGKYGCTTKILKISKYGTIDEMPTFDEVINELYEEEIARYRKKGD